jgi:hypothetical protein
MASALFALGIVHADASSTARDEARVAPPPIAQRWPADASLREGMGRVRIALDELRHFEMGHMDATMALDRVGLIEQAVADVFARCALPPQRDAVLHRMLVALLDAARRFRAHPDAAASAAMRAAMADYPRYFDDPAWPPPRPSTMRHDH